MTEKFIVTIRHAMMSVCDVVEETAIKLREELAEGIYDDYIREQIDETIKAVAERQANNNG